VAVKTFYWRPPEDYYLIISALVAYKRLDSAIRVFSKSGRKLRIAGDGAEYKALKRQAGRNVEFCGYVPEDQLRALYASSRAFILPGEEDFGITVIEALASGKPVIALGRGGALETVPTNEPMGGILYPEATDESLGAAVSRFEQREAEIDPKALQVYASAFSEEEFNRKMRMVLGMPTNDQLVS
jgi:glycosyltransferase involved in cell wall biosynthesis